MESNEGSPEQLTRVDQLTRALGELRAAAGTPSYAVLIHLGQRRDPAVVFTKTSLSGWFAGRTVPGNAEVFRALVETLQNLADKRGSPHRHRNIRRLEQLRAAAEYERTTNGASTPVPPAERPASSEAPQIPLMATESLHGRLEVGHTWRRNSAIVASVAVLVVLALVVGLWRAWDSDSEGKAESEDPGASTGSTTSAPRTGTSSSLQDASLRSTIVSLTDHYGGANLAFPDRNSPSAEEYLAMPRLPGTLPDFALRATSDGAFLLGGAVTEISLEGTVDGHEVAIFGVRPVNLRRVPFPGAAALLLRSQGGPTDEMQVTLDDPAPAAKIPLGQPGAGTPYFRSQRIGLSASEKATLSVSLEALRSSFTFELAIDYEVGGHTYTHTVGTNGKPFTFRVAADPCPSALTKQALTGKDLGELSQARFTMIRGSYLDESAREYLIRDEDAAQYTHDGPGCGSRTTAPRPG